jgi:hypothetical protein
MRWVDPDTPVSGLASLLRPRAITMAETDRCGLTDRDLICRRVAADMHAKTARARQVMGRGIVFCLERPELIAAGRPTAKQDGSGLLGINARKGTTGMLGFGGTYSAGPTTPGKKVMGVCARHHK